MTRPDFIRHTTGLLANAGATDIAFTDDDVPSPSFEFKGKKYSYLGEIPGPPGDSGSGIVRNTMTAGELRAGMYGMLLGRLTGPLA